MIALNADGAGRRKRPDLGYQCALWVWKRTGKEKLYRRLDRVLRRPSINIVSVVDEMVRRAQRRGRTDVEAIALGEVQRRMQAGCPVSESFGDMVDPVERMLLQGGENAIGGGEEGRRTGLQRVFALLVRRLDAARRMRQAVFRAWANLVIYCAMILASLMAFSDYVIPRIALLYPVSRWGEVATSMLVASRMVRSDGFILVLGALVLFGLSLPFIQPYWTGRLRRVLDRFPPLGFYRLQQGGAWLASIPALTASGRLKAYDALVETERLSKPWMRERLRAIRKGMTGGLGMGRAMQQSGYAFPDREIVDEISLYESQGLDIESVLQEVADAWAETGYERVVRQADAILSGARVIFAFIVLWFTLGIVMLQVQMPNYFMSVAHLG
ncbi:type IV pilus biogenesis protein [mine drainage metagenome]|uniref:Type IV pilus biogenesis protein n=2 Tax=mine drainage metagenome TaxID=410659 RepID=T1B343_9ZZZZ